MPTEPLDVQLQNKAAWNEARPNPPDFYTIGYTSRNISTFVGLLVDAGVQTVLDVRFAAVSMYKPDFSKRNLQRYLADAEIAYLHKPELGVPRDIRGRAARTGSRDAIWDWYDSHALPEMTLQRFFNWADHPVALLCTEIDPTACHRHRIALALESHGLTCQDL